ncbi:hypothetical protein [Acaryochloris sp. CCMEE 5410]|uniref:hypothetical protein n=1 Tax=Acaryochloris sp. CCMEE 5410 TaxID=310037 RepID=UPI0002483F87|nr:hypothetical protein [Acaryochloris sp. CCMEE 5410]KAI9129543.1 hypothetical protein ON05_033070 [Acaryochloris sp. CCMEE 5410]
MPCLEPLTASIEILELREVDCDWMGDLLGYFAMGHYEPATFAQAVNAEYDPDIPAEAHQICHEFWVEVSLEPDELDCNCTCLKTCKADVDGAFAVTYIEL